MKLLALTIVVLAASLARADIIEWRDADGVRHYTNLREEIPEAQRQAAQVVVDEAVRRRAPEPDPLPAAAPEPPRQAQAVYDRSMVVDAYQEGFERGLELARGGSREVGGGGGGGVVINGPLAVASAPAAAPFYYADPYAYPLVTTSFDRGRSRHLTLRQLMENQFLVDREGPYAFIEPPIPSPNLFQYLPRGLPCRGACQRRVIVR